MNKNSLFSAALQLFIVFIAAAFINSAFAFESNKSSSSFDIVPVQSPADTGSTFLCEQFESTTFPPSGWTLEYSGTLYWFRANMGSFGSSGSASYDMWDAPKGTDQSLITPVFPATSAGDSLIMDMSYFQYFSNIDSLIIMTSANGGLNYTPQNRLGSSVLNTCPPNVNCNFNRHWLKRTFLLPAGTNRIQFLGKSGFGDYLFLDSICILSHVLGIININEIAASYSLSQNYPNPFNPSTVISYSMPKPGNVKITISDINGRQVKVLADGYKAAGNYETVFDASLFASGVYFYRLESGDFKQTKKMLLIK